MTVALLSNVTVTSLAMRLCKTSHEEIYSPNGYNTWLQEMSDPGSRLYANEPRAVFILLHGRALLGESDAGREDVSGVLSTMADAIEHAAGAHNGTVFVPSTLDFPQKKIRPLVSHSVEAYASALWRETMESRGMPLLDLSEIVSDIGRERFYNNRVWYMGYIPFSKQGEEALALEMGRIWRAISGTRKKCLALDLDGTLWGGAIGELGVEGVHLDSSGSGSRFRDFQRRILDLKELGVLLAVISKNNPEDAMAGIREHPSMILREKDFAAIRTNWAPKSDNLLSIARELNIGADSFVFIDDNPVERETMQIALPEVTVPDFPADTAQLEGFIADVAREYFLQLRATEEDMTRTEQYRSETERRGQMSSFANVQDYLASLDMVLSVEGLTDHNLPRAAQLTQKTNQFNLTTRRYSEAEMGTLRDDPDSRVYVGQLRDRFGDYGNIALCVAGILGDRASIDVFLMSCRVMGRGVERAFMRFVEGDLQSSGINEIDSLYLPTPKNEVVRDFWRSMGYEETGTLGDGVKYSFRPTDVRDGLDIVKIEKKETICRSC
jgi:FkbH-like protein